MSDTKKQPMQLGIAVVLGIASGVGLYFLLDYLRRRQDPAGNLVLMGGLGALSLGAAAAFDNRAVRSIALGAAGAALINFVRSMESVSVRNDTAERMIREHYGAGVVDVEDQRPDLLPSIEMQTHRY